MRVSRFLPVFSMLLGLMLAACTPLDKDSGQPVEGDSSADKPSPLATLTTDEQKVAWIIGSQIGQQLTQIKDEIDFSTLMRAAREHMEGKGDALDQNEVMTIMQAFDEKMQAKQQAEMQAQAEKNTAEGQAFLEENGKKPEVTTTDSGLQYEVLTQGDGPKPGPMDTVRVHYHGTLLDGSVFDSSVERGEPAQFRLDGVIPGWREGVELMPVGSKYRLWLPGILAYGQNGGPGGPNATLVFEVELLEIVPSE